MALTKEQKQSIVAEVAEVARTAHSAVAAEYRKLTVEVLTGLRTKARTQGVFLKVVKNTLASRAVAGTQFECMQKGLVGPLLLAFSREDPGSAARLIRDFRKDNEALVVKLVSVGGQLLGPGDLDRLASLPTRDEAIARLMAVMKAPIQKFVRTLAEPHAKLVRTVAAIRDRKQAA